MLEHKRETGCSDPDIDWQDGGCVRLARWEPRPMSLNPDPGPPYPVCLVRLVDPTGAGGSSWVMVDARTGEEGACIGAALKAGCADEVRPHVTSTDAD